MSKKILIYGGSSLISKELINLYYKEDYNFIIFCRKKELVLSYLVDLKLDNNKFKIFDIDLIDLQKNLDLVSKLEDNIDGVIWISGYTGDAENEFSNIESASKNIKINFLHPVLIINKLLPKIIGNGKGFLAVVCSVAGLRGRAKNIFYGSSKSGLITYLSGLRQKFHNKLNILTIIPGYMSTNSFKQTAPGFLITSPKKAASIIVRAIRTKKEIIYINSFWRIIMFFVKNIPEKIFKKLKF
mgnify:CR=1 FL=1